MPLQRSSCDTETNKHSHSFHAVSYVTEEEINSFLHMQAIEWAHTLCQISAFHNTVMGLNNENLCKHLLGLQLSMLLLSTAAAAGADSSDRMETGSESLKCNIAWQYITAA